MLEQIYQYNHTKKLKMKSTVLWRWCRHKKRSALVACHFFNIFFTKIYSTGSYEKYTLKSNNEVYFSKWPLISRSNLIAIVICILSITMAKGQIALVIGLIFVIFFQTIFRVSLIPNRTDKQKIIFSRTPHCDNNMIFFIEIDILNMGPWNDSHGNDMNFHFLSGNQIDVSTLWFQRPTCAESRKWYMYSY